MSKMTANEFRQCRVEVLTHKPRHTTPVATNPVNTVVPGGSEFVYVNPAFVASTQSVRIPEQRPVQVSPQRRLRPIQVPAQTSVVLEQYWACSRWTLAQRLLVIAVAVLLGAVIGLVITVVLYNGRPSDLVGGSFFNFGSAPD